MHKSIQKWDHKCEPQKKQWPPANQAPDLSEMVYVGMFPSQWDRLCCWHLTASGCPIFNGDFSILSTLSDPGASQVMGTMGRHGSEWQLEVEGSQWEATIDNARRCQKAFWYVFTLWMPCTVQMWWRYWSPEGRGQGQAAYSTRK